MKVPLVSECGVRHSGCNLSRHSPIYVRLKFESLPVKSIVQSTAPRRPAWSRAAEKDTETTPPCYRRDCIDWLCRTVSDVTTRSVTTSHTPRTVTPCFSGRAVFCGRVMLHHHSARRGGKGGEGRTARGGVPGRAEKVTPYQMDSNYWNRVWGGAAQHWPGTWQDGPYNCARDDWSEVKDQGHDHARGYSRC